MARVPSVLRFQVICDELDRVGISGPTPSPSRPSLRSVATTAYTNTQSIPLNKALPISPTASVSSWQSSCNSDTMSCTSSVSSATSRPPREQLEGFDPHFQQLAMAPFPHGYVLPCEFAFLGCNLQFNPEYQEDWISHSASHFSTHSPPPKVICTFCNREYDSVERGIDPMTNWTSRMIHIERHFWDSRRVGDQEMVHPRPDYFVLDYMLHKNLLSKKDYLHLIQYTERPECENLYSLGYQTPEMKRRAETEERRARQTHNLDNERRRMKRGKIPKENRPSPTVSRREVKISTNHYTA
ncbi:uncharacterized protein BP5553_03345 [Venustampulla echinocandica]|uniref:Uncharacterized protein n=1 Tax=Venustampulla echinocandica TaxID=2656787 RepID=A0A370TU06_9HELO|nr:uncharacterized protein BP5553_03345 [Venustampulla echinocandica]RDL39005.1 hypothetical protein BP5553_03345 [Venustampulla echinocandica]